MDSRGKQQITLRQREIYEWIKGFFRDKTNQRMPTYREIGRHFGIRSPNAIAYHIEQIVAVGMLDRVPHKTGCGYSPIRFPAETFRALLASC